MHGNSKGKAMGPLLEECQILGYNGLYIRALGTGGRIMPSNFDFLNCICPNWAEIGNLAETYLYSDPNFSIKKRTAQRVN